MSTGGLGPALSAWRVHTGEVVRTGGTVRTTVWLARAAGFVLIGILTFNRSPSGLQALPLLIAGYTTCGLAMLVWAWVDWVPAGAPISERWLPVIFGVIAAASGLAATPNGGSLIIIFAAIAGIAAGSDTSTVASWTVTAIGVLCLEAGSAIYGDSLAAVLGYPLLLVGTLMIGHNRRTYRIQATQAAALLKQSQQLQAQQRRGDILDERARIAREIHDVLAHSLGALGIQIQAARAVLTDHQDVDKALDILGTAQRMAADGLAETRHAVHALRTDTRPLSEEITATTDSHAARHHVAVEVVTAGQPGQLSPAASMALLRVAQESLVNAAKHAPGQPISVRLDYSGQDVKLTISNPLARSRPTDPIGATLSTANTGYGLTGMRERLLLVNGTLTTGQQDNQWVVTATVSQPSAQPGPVPSAPATPASAGTGAGPTATIPTPPDAGPAPRAPTPPGPAAPAPVPRGGAGSGKLVP